MQYVSVYGFYEKFVFWFTPSIQISVLLLNAYWLSLIFQGTIRKCKRSKKGDNPKKIN
jgi:hypothetical protein